jgi:2-dehydro-3-deoxyphosphogluconate aldolase/(4S)-4-hydroxy-2-oxoglutarate aldolase
VERTIEKTEQKVMMEIYERIANIGVVPVIAIDDVESALPLADALIGGGLPLAEITFRTSAAAGVLRKLRDERPELLLGAGTILNVDDLHRAKDSGAAFALAPGFNPVVVKEALRIGLPFAPGVMTPSEVEGALDLGIQVMKFFPAGDAGGTRMLNSLSGPYAHKGVRFIPTGGVTIDNFREYLAVKTVLAVGGTWIAKRDDIAAGNWDVIRNHCERVVSQLKGPQP